MDKVWSSLTQIRLFGLLIMKQNQSLFRPFPGENPEVKPHDKLSFKSSCSCTSCGIIKDQLHPEICLDHDLTKLRSNRNPLVKCDQVIFLDYFHKAKGQLPRFRFLDTIVLEGGQVNYAITFKEGRAKIQFVGSIKAWITQRKQQLDLRYQIKKYQRQRPDFHFAAFEHESEKRIKEFENNIKYKMPPILNKIAIIKMKGVPEQLVITKLEFQDLFSSTKTPKYSLSQLEYIQVFPVMYGEQGESYEKSIKYFRERQRHRRGFKLAECNYSTWKQRNQSLEKLQEKVFDEISAQTGEQPSQDMQLQYITYKLLIFFEDISNQRIQQAIVNYITNDKGRTFYFKNIECIKFQNRTPIEGIGVERLTKKQTAPEQRIQLRTQMNKVFQGFQEQFKRLDKQRQQMEDKVKKDKDFSNYVFKTITSKNGDNLHKILQSSNLKYKKQQLKL